MCRTVGVFNRLQTSDNHWGQGAQDRQAFVIAHGSAKTHVGNVYAYVPRNISPFSSMIAHSNILSSFTAESIPRVGLLPSLSGRAFVTDLEPCSIYSWFSILVAVLKVQLDKIGATSLDPLTPPPHRLTSAYDWFHAIFQSPIRNFYSSVTLQLSEGVAKSVGITRVRFRFAASDEI